MSRYEPIKISWVIQILDKPSCTFLPRKRETHTDVSKLYLNSEEKNKNNNNTCNISKKSKTKAKNPSMCLCVLAPHMENAPCEKHQSLKDYITHLPLAFPFNRVWKKSERPLQRQHWSLLVLNYKSSTFFFLLPPSTVQHVSLTKMDCSAKHYNFFFFFLQRWNEPFQPF